MREVGPVRRASLMQQRWNPHPSCAARSKAEKMLMKKQKAKAFNEEAAGKGRSAGGA